MRSRVLFVGLIVVVASAMGFFTALTDAATQLNGALSASSSPVVSTSTNVVDPNNVPVVSDDGRASGCAHGCGACVHEPSDAISRLTGMVIVLRRELADCMGNNEGPPSNPFPPLLEAGWDK